MNSVSMLVFLSVTGAISGVVVFVLLLTFNLLEIFRAARAEVSSLKRKTEQLQEEMVLTRIPHHSMTSNQSGFSLRLSRLEESQSANSAALIREQARSFEAPTTLV